MAWRSLAITSCAAAVRSGLSRRVMNMRPALAEFAPAPPPTVEVTVADVGIA